MLQESIACLVLVGETETRDKIETKENSIKMIRKDSTNRQQTATAGCWITKDRLSKGKCRDYRDKPSPGNERE